MTSVTNLSRNVTRRACDSTLLPSFRERTTLTFTFYRDDMSVLLKLPLLAAIAWSVRVTLTSPQPPPSAKELYGAADLALLLPRAVKVLLV